MMRYVTLTGFILLLAAVCFVPTGIIFQSRHDSTLTVISRSGSPIRSIGADTGFVEAYFDEYFVEGTPPTNELPFVNVLKPGDPSIVQIRCMTGGRSSRALLWQKSTFVQPTRLGVVVEYADGRRVGQVFDLPNLREENSMQVQFP